MKNIDEFVMHVENNKMYKRIINCITCKHWVSQDTFGVYYNCELTPLRPESNIIRECENYEENNK